MIVGLILSLVPVIFGFDKDNDKDNHDWAQQPTAARILWPCCFMLGFVSVCIIMQPCKIALNRQNNRNSWCLEQGTLTTLIDMQASCDSIV